MNLREMKTAKVWIASERRLTNLLNLSEDLDDILGDENFTIFRKSEFVDLHNQPIYEGHILRINPMDDDWLDVVVYKEYLKSGLASPVPVHRLELSSFEDYNKTTNLSFEDAVDKDNPAEIVGHAITHPHLLFSIMRR